MIRSVVEGDVEAFGELYDRHAPAAFGLAHLIVGDPRLAENICHDAFLQLWRSAALYASGRTSARTVLLGIVRDRAIDAVRRRAGDRSLAAAECQLRELSEVLLPAADACTQRLAAVLHHLPDEQRQAIALAWYGQLNHIEIAWATFTTPGTVKTHLRLGMQELLQAQHRQ